MFGDGMDGDGIDDRLVAFAAVGVVTVAEDLNDAQNKIRIIQLPPALFLVRAPPSASPY